MYYRERIFEYVIDQFYAIFQPNQTFDISYGLNSQSRIQITPTSSAFFENSQPLPEEAPVYYEWQGFKVPFWFDTKSGDEVILYEEDKAIIQPDIIAGGFYFLSGWQEYHSSRRDQYGRFPYQESLQYKHQLITKPIVNYYFDILKTAIEHVYGVQLLPVFARDAAFTTCLTHDIDNCETAWLVEGAKAIRKGRLPMFLHLILKKIAGQDNWSNIPEVVKTVQNNNAVSSFFFLANNQKFQQIANADYDISEAKYQNWLNLLGKKNFEIGIHGSHITAFEAGQLQAEIRKLNTPVRGNHFHYLRFEPRETPHLLEASNLEYDTTLGFSEHFGFRHGTCFPFRLFNFKTRQAFRFLEIPLHLMDVTLYHPNYLQLQTDDLLPALTPMLLEIKKFNGCFTWLWHNENFSVYNQQNGPQAFQSIMDWLQHQGSSFKTTGQVSTLLNNPAG